MSSAKKILILLVFFIFLIVGTIALVLGDGGQPLAYIPSTTVISKVRAAEKQGISIDLQEEDVNSIFSIYLGKGKSKGNVTMKGLTATFGVDSMVIKMPVEYKGIPLLVSAGGKSTYSKDENKVEFQPYFYKIGNLPIPKKLAETFLKKNSFKGIEFEDDLIKISTSLIPFSIQNIDFKNNSILLTLKKTDTLADLLPKNTKATPDVVTPKDDRPKDDSPPAVVKPNSDTKNSLSQINGQIQAAVSTLQSSKEKEVLQKIMNTINSINANAAYNYTSDVSEVKAKYNALTKEEKERVKVALLSNVDMDTAMKVKNIFGI